MLSRRDDHISCTDQPRNFRVVIRQLVDMSRGRGQSRYVFEHDFRSTTWLQHAMRVCLVVVAV